MAQSTHHCTACLIICLTLTLYLLPVSQGKLSDACHGHETFNQTHNILECVEGSEICITEVRYYQWDGDTNSKCSLKISKPVPPRCCQHNVSRCSWVRSASDHRAELQGNCTGKSRCDLQSTHPELIADPCTGQPISQYSSVRSVTYTCTSTDHIPNEMSETRLNCTHHPVGDRIQTGPEDVIISPAPSLTLPGNRPCPPLSTTGSPKAETGAIVGGVIGGLVACAVIAVLLFVLLKHRGEKVHRPADTPTAADVTVIGRPNQGYDNVVPRYSFYQPDRDDNSTAWNRQEPVRLSDMYPKVNKNSPSRDGKAFSVQSTTGTPNGHSDYDRVQGEALHFRVHGDYDHVVGVDDTEGASVVVPNLGVMNDADLAYDQLHRGMPVAKQADDDHYHVLNRAKTSLA